MLSCIFTEELIAVFSVDSLMRKFLYKIFLYSNRQAPNEEWNSNPIQHGFG